MIRIPGWDLGMYIHWLIGRADDPAKLAEAMSETIAVAEVTLVTPFGSVLADRSIDGKRWHVYVFDGSNLGLTTKSDDEYSGSYGGRAKTEAEMRYTRNSLLNVLNFLLVWDQTPEELREKLVNSEQSLRSLLMR